MGAVLDARGSGAGDMRRIFIRARDSQLRLVRAEKRTMRQAFTALFRTYERMLSAFLRVPATSYGDWVERGPKRELDELSAAVSDPAIWDSLVETFDTRTVE